MGAIDLNVASRVSNAAACTYTGKEWDKETGLYYLRNRYYDPMEGRFISKDPIGFAGGLNLYGYTQNNPINAKDPNGLASYSGEVELTTAGRFIVGGSYLRGKIQSSCVNGKRQVGNLSATFYGLSVGLPLTDTFFTITVEDWVASAPPNLNNLNGIATMVSIGAAIPGKGFSLSNMMLGQTETPDIPGKESGIDFGGSIMRGTSRVTNIHEESCRK